MTNEIALTEDNPLRELRLADGTGSARDVQKSGYVHATWRKWELAIQRGQALIADQHGENAGQAHVAPTGKKVELGQNTQREVHDYRG